MGTRTRREMKFNVGADGFMGADMVKVRPDPGAHGYLNPAFTIAGTVRDADTGEWSRIQLSIGCLRKHRDGSTIRGGVRLIRFSPKFAGGKFRHTLGNHYRWNGESRLSLPL